jgi:peptidoglycan pentaglycine glycine transferase (the first glycine)
MADVPASTTLLLAEHADRLVGTLDVPLSPLYPLWVRAVPWAKRLLRAGRRG